MHDGDPGVAGNSPNGFLKAASTFSPHSMALCCSGFAGFAGTWDFPPFLWPPSCGVAAGEFCCWLVGWSAVVQVGVAPQFLHLSFHLVNRSAGCRNTGLTRALAMWNCLSRLVLSAAGFKSARRIVLNRTPAIFKVSVMEKNAIAAVISSRGWAIAAREAIPPRFQKGNTGAAGIAHATAGTSSPPMLDSGLGAAGLRQDPCHQRCRRLWLDAQEAQPLTALPGMGEHLRARGAALPMCVKAVRIASRQCAVEKVDQQRLPFFTAQFAGGRSSRLSGDRMIVNML